MTETPRPPRGFVVMIEPDQDGSFGLRLGEVPHEGRPPRPVAHLSPKRTSRVVEHALDAVRASGHARSTLSVHLREPLRLHEAPGLRLALIMFATGPMQKRSRVEAAAAAIDRLGDEEAYYWYGKCVGQSARRARRALRLLLADE